MEIYTPFFSLNIAPESHPPPPLCVNVPVCLSPTDHIHEQTTFDKFVLEREGRISLDVSLSSHVMGHPHSDPELVEPFST